MISGRFNRRITRYFLAVSLVLFFGAFSTTSFATTVKEIHVESRGSNTIDVASVLAFTSLKPGDTYSAAAVSQDVKNMQKSGHFSVVDVVLEHAQGGGVNVTYVVKIRPRIRRLTITGADELGNGRVRDLMGIGAGDMADDGTIAAAAQQALDKYHSKLYPYAKITWTVDEDEAANLADVHVTVKEGPRASVYRVDFTGNQVLTRRKLYSPMRQHERNWFSWLTGSGVYNPDDLEADRETIRELYQNIGYLDASVGEPQVKDLGDGKLEITIPVSEGRPYVFGSSTVEGAKIFPSEKVATAITNKPGEVASMATIRGSGEAVRDYYGSRGYIETYVKNEVNADPSNGVANVEYKVKEGSLAHIRDINVHGNTRTKDKVIRRELAVYPGEIVNEVKVRTSEQRLRNLGYFSSVNSSYEKTIDPDYYDVNFDLEEQRTGQFMIGAGFSSIDKLVGFVEVSQGNFDLFNWPYFSGGGQKINLRAQIGTKRNDYEITFIEPWFLDQKLSLAVSLFRNVNNYYSSQYTQRNTGGSVSLTKPVTAYDRISLKYTLQQIDIYDIDDDASDEIKKESGARMRSSLTPSFVHDTRDNPFVPTRGNKTEASFDVAGGPLGCSVNMYGMELRSSQFWTIWFDHILSLRGWTAVVDRYDGSDEVYIFDRLFLGGPKNLRGFKYRMVGPVDENDQPLGGRTSYYAAGEYEIPIIKYLRFGVYYDIGMVWSEAYRYDSHYNSDFGIGLRIDIPGFPLRFDYAWPMKADEYNDHPSGVFSFMIGYIY